MSELKNLMEKARNLAKGRDSMEAWSRLKGWANSHDHPFAMKAAVFQFLELHATDPDAVRIIPEVLQNATRLPLEKAERQDLSALADRALKTQELNLRASRHLPVSEDRPAPILFLNPMKAREADIYTPLTPSRDAEHLIAARDTLIHVNDKILKKVKQDGQR